ncbi:hypothetical protein [Pollutibacter soli]|uniref:hypothetical protein n=1 Tax=Pollutibacter soli TaxID=3034157 RepID=UPI003013AEDA
MFSLFKRKNKPVFYFVGQEPKERINNFILEFIKPIFDKREFQFKEGSFNFFKSGNSFKQEVFFKRSSYNLKDKVIRFDPIFCLFDLEYEKWYKSFYKKKTDDYCLFWSSGGHIANWDKQFIDNIWYDLAAVDNDILIKIITRNIENIALPNLERLSNREIAFETLRQTSFNICAILFDYCIIENNKEKARLIIEDFEYYLNSDFKDQYQGLIEKYEIRKHLFKNWA